MTTQPVDLFIAHSMEPDSSPISMVGIFGAMLNGEFDELLLEDRDCQRLDLEYNPWVAEIDGIKIFLDHGPDGIEVTIEDQGQTWKGYITGDIVG